MSAPVNTPRRGIFRPLGWTFRRLRDGWCIVGLAAILFLAVDRLAAWLWDDSGVGVLVQSAPFRQASPALDDYDLASLAQEIEATHDSPFVATRFRWEPLVYWRSQTHAGRWINVNERGLRRTTSPGASSISKSNEAIQIFCFGGSTMWGACVPDEATIPSQLSAHLARAGAAATVTNFAQMGYVSTQSRITLEQELTRGNRPDIVVFYDGFNDVGAAMANPEPGLPGDEYQRPTRESHIRQPTLWGLGDHYLRSSFLARLFQPDWRQQVADQIARNVSNVDTDQLAVHAVERYLNNLRIVQALAEKFDFEARYYWQPLLCTRRQPADGERSLAGKEPGVERIHQRARQALADTKHRRAAGDNAVDSLRDLSDVFDGSAWRDQTVFFDACHLGTVGNEAVAAALAEDLGPLVKKRRTKPK